MLSNINQFLREAIKSTHLTKPGKPIPLRVWCGGFCTPVPGGGGGEIMIKPFFGESGVVLNKGIHKKLFIVFKKHPVGYTEEDTATITIKHCATETGLFTDFMVLNLPYSGPFGNSKATDVDITTMEEWFQIEVEYGEDGEVFSTLLILANSADLSLGDFSFPLNPLGQ